MIHEAETKEEAEEHIGAIYQMFQEMHDLIDELRQTELMLQSQVDELSYRVAELEN